MHTSSFQMHTSQPPVHDWNSKHSPGMLCHFFLNIFARYPGFWPQINIDLLAIRWLNTRSPAFFFYQGPVRWMKQHINIRQKINANLRPPNLFSRSYGKVEEDPGSHEIDQGSTYACQTKLVKFSWVHGLNPFMNHLSNTYLRLPTKNHLFGRFFAIGLRLNVKTILLEPTDSNEDHDNGRGVSARLCWPLLLAWTAWTAWTFVSWVDRAKRPSDSPCLVLNRSKQFSFF